MVASELAVLSTLLRDNRIVVLSPAELARRLAVGSEELSAYELLFSTDEVDAAAG